MERIMAIEFGKRATTASLGFKLDYILWVTKVHLFTSMRNVSFEVVYSWSPKAQHPIVNTFLLLS